MNDFLSEKALNMIGLCKRAGKLTSGEQQVLENIKSKKAKLVIISCDVFDNTKKRITDKCISNGIRCIVFSDRNTLGKYTGKEFTVCISINDINFANEIIKLTESV